MSSTKPQTKHWYILPCIPPEIDHELGEFPSILRQLLFNRNIKHAPEAHAYLQAISPADTDPFKLNGIPEAVKRIQYAIRKAEPIAIYGDYDADGVTATALLTLVLRALGADVLPYIPNRFDEGYGLNLEALEALKSSGRRLVITVDCGIRSMKEAEYAQNLGLDLIISDHHHPIGDEIPKAIAVIDQKKAGDSYPDKNLAGVGLAYKLAEALISSYASQKASELPSHVTSLLDLVTLGTVADLVPLTGENRSLVRQGLRLLRQPQRQGIYSLIVAAGLKPERVSSRDVGFVLGPRINAAGRLDSALAALHLLITEDVAEAGKLAQQLNVQNQERQKLTQEIQARAEQIALEADPEALLLFAAHPEFNPGVVGLAASRLSESHYRPAIVASQGPDYTRASCRSIPEFHITEALDQCADLLEHHGGHAAAAGFTVRNENLNELIARLKDIAARQIGGLDLRAQLKIDLELPLSDLKPEILQYLDLLEPTGQENPPALFVSRNLKIKQCRLVGTEQNHLKLTVTDGRIIYDAIAFQQAHWYNYLTGPVDLAYTFEVNEFNGQQSLQLRVKDIKLSGSGDT